MKFILVRLSLILLIVHHSIDSTICRWSPIQCGCAFYQPIIRTRIVGGIESIPHSWPWIVSIRLASTNSPFCGGSLITNRYVLTAAHCFYDELKKTGGKTTVAIRSKYIFVIGAHYSTEKNTYLNSHLRVSANLIIIHPQYDTNTKVNDIALIELSRSVDLTDKTIGFICLPMATLRYPKLFPSDQANAVAIGWGRIREGSLGRASNVLLQVELPIQSPYIRPSDCADQVYDPEKQFCAGITQGGKDTCQGDSGGPLMLTYNHTWQIVGITSYGEGCARARKPGVYTRVSVYRDWINYTISKNILNYETQLFNIPNNIDMSNDLEIWWDREVDINLILADNSSSYNQCQSNWYYLREETICLTFATSQAGDVSWYNGYKACQTSSAQLLTFSNSIKFQSVQKKIHELEYDDQIYLDYIQRGAWIGNAKWSKDDLCDSTSTTIEDLQLNCIILTIRSNNQSLCLKRVSCREKHPFICQKKAMTEKELVESTMERLNFLKCIIIIWCIIDHKKQKDKENKEALEAVLALNQALQLQIYVNQFDFELPQELQLNADEETSMLPNVDKFTILGFGIQDWMILIAGGFITLLMICICCTGLIFIYQFIKKRRLRQYPTYRDG
ncbi:unnamed protein product, partial [Rotaria sp. Silwood1]